MFAAQASSERAVILAPLGRDARVAAQILQAADVEAVVCADLSALATALDAGAGVAILAEEAVLQTDLRELKGWIDAQPPWSDLPVLLMTQRGAGPERATALERAVGALGAVSLLERPFHAAALTAAVRTALRARRRQYQARSHAEALATSERSLRFALEAGQLGSWELDIDTRALRTSRTCRRIYGRDEGSAFSFDELLADVHPDDLPVMAGAVQRSVDGSADYDVVYRVRRPDGLARWVEARGRRVDSPGATPMMAGIVRDVTEEHLAAEALQASEARYRTLTETLPQLVWTCLPDGSCDYLSTQWVDYTGVGMAEQLGLDWLDRVIHPDDRARTLDHWMGAVEGRNAYDIEYRIRSRHGTYRWFKTRGTPVRDPATGETMHWFGTCTDIQEIVEAREIMARSGAQLAGLVAERTAELEQTMVERERAEAALRQSQKMEAVGQLTGGVAHDFNNLLQVIGGGLDIMDRAATPERRARIVGAMRQAADRGAQLTRQLLAFSRKQALRPERIDLRERVLAMRELLDRSLRADVVIATRFAEGLWPVNVDPTQLELAILNIAVNARDAMPSGGDLTLSADNAPDLHEEGLAGDYVTLSVTDTGEGMTPEVMARVFEPFFTTKEVGKGSGLGLPQIYGFAEQSGGKVRIQSAPGRGTTITLLLPRAEPGATLPEAGASTSSPTAPPPPAPDAPAPLILLVEDDDEVASLASEMLTQLGYRSTRVATAAAALGALADGRPVDAVFSDVMMPGGMNGADLAREIARRRPGLPIVLTTGYDGHAQHTGGEFAETFELEVLRKPYRLDSLSDVLARALDGPARDRV